MRKKENIEDLISSSLTEILERSMSLDRKDQIAIYQEFEEWIRDDTKEEKFGLSIVQLNNEIFNPFSTNRESQVQWLC